MIACKTNIFVSSVCLILLFLAVVNTGFSQKILLEGVVYSNEQLPLEFANVMGFDKAGKSIRSFAVTDIEGKFRIELEQDSSYLLKASFLGYEEWSEVITPQQEYPFKTIILQPAANNLNEVTVVYELPVAVSGDTISYRVDAFTTGKERKLKDVFEKLPGFEVGENGQIKVNGEKVDKLTIDGKDFFSGDTKLATKNIPANVVDKVNVLGNQNDFNPMQDFGGDSGLAIDINLKADKQNIVFGSVEAGGGPEKRYLGHTNVFYFKPKMSLNFIGNLNNISEQVFTFRDYFRFNGGMNGIGRNTGVSMRLSSDALGMGIMKENKAQNLETKVGAMNFTANPNNKIAFSGFAIMSGLKSVIQDESSRTYIGQENKEVLTAANTQNARTGIFKFNTRYRPNTDLHLEHDLLVKHTRTDEQKSLLSENSFDTRSFDSDNVNTVPSFRQRFEIFFTENQKNISSLSVSQLYDDKKTDYNLATTEQIYPTVIPLTRDTVYNLFQHTKIRTHKIDLALNHYYILNKTNHLNFTGGYTISKQKLTSGLGQSMDNEQAIDFDQNNLKNDVDYQFEDIFAGLNSKSRFGKLTINPGVTLHRFSLVNTQQNNRVDFEKYLLLPHLHAKYKFRKSVSLKLDYSIQAEFQDVQQYADNNILRTYNELFNGNRNLYNSWYHNLNVNYYSTNLFNYTNVYGMLSYQRKYDHMNNQVIYEGIDRYSTPVNVSEPNDFLSAYGSYERRFKFFKMNLNANLAYTKYNSIFEDNELTVNKSITQEYTGTMETTSDKFPVLEIGFKSIINHYSNNTISGQRYITNRPFANIEVTFLKNFILVADYEYNWYQSQDGATSSSYDILNAELYYKRGDSPFEFKITCLNLLDNQSIRQDFFSDALISTNEYFIQPRYFIGSLKYEF